MLLKATKSILVATRNLKHWVLGPSRAYSFYTDFSVVRIQNAVLPGSGHGAHLGFEIA